MNRIIIGSMIITLTFSQITNIKPTTDKEKVLGYSIIKEQSLIDQYKKVQPIIVKTSVEEERVENVYEWEINRPQIEVVDNNDISELINKEVSKGIDGYVEKMKFIKDVKEGEERKSPYKFTIKSEVLTNKDGVFSIKLNRNYYYGVEHIYYRSDFYNFDLLKGKEIELKDLFKEDVDSLELIYNIIFEQIKDNEKVTTNLQKYYEYKIEPNFFIRDGKIYIYFGLYTLGPYEDGEHEFKISMEDVEGKLSEFGKVIYSICKP